MIAPDAHVAVVEALEANQWDLFRSLARVEMHDDGDVLWVVTGVPVPAFNGVLRTHVPPQRVDATVEMLSADLARSGLPWSWYVGPASWPLDLAERLEAHGFRQTDELPGMAAPLDGHPAVPSARTRPLRFERVREEPSVAAFGTLLGLAFDMPAEVVEPLLRIIDATEVANYVAFDGGEPVACGSLLLAAGVAGLYNIGVPPARRGTGVGTAMTAALMAEAAAGGARTAVLTSTPAGLRCYRALGFEERCRLRLYGRA